MGNIKWNYDESTQQHFASTDKRSAVVRLLFGCLWLVTLCGDGRVGEQIAVTLKDSTTLGELFLNTGEGLEGSKKVGTADSLLAQLKVKHGV